MFYVVLLIIIEVILFAANYIWGTHLMGWDNIMPEFNLALNFKRALFSVWQEYRGLGLLDGMSHVATLTHTLYIALLSIFLPQSVVRYVFIFLTHLTGGISMFYLLRHLLNSHSGKPQRSGDASRIPSKARFWSRPDYIGTPQNDKGVAAFIGALFYMFNIGVIQMYYAPLEVFAVHFAALPLLVLLTIKALNNPSRKNLFILFIAGFLTSTQAFVPTVFFAFFVLFVFILMFYPISSRPKAHQPLAEARTLNYSSSERSESRSFENLKIRTLNLFRYLNFDIRIFNRNWKSGISPFLYSKRLKRAALILFVVIAANAFWMMPYVYSGAKNASVIQKTRINEFSSEEIYFRNAAKGDLVNVLTLSGFMMDSIERDLVNIKNIYIMDAWRQHTNNIFYKLGIGLIGFVGLTGLVGIILKREKKYFPFIFAAGVAFFFLANNTPVLEQLNNVLRYSFPVIGEAYRFPFTKFITLFVFCLSVFIGLGINFIYFLLENYQRNNFKFEYKDLTNSKFKMQNAKLQFKIQNFYLILNYKLQLLIFNFKLLTNMIIRIIDIKTAKIIVSVICFSIIFYLALPAFRGYFVYPYLKTKLPDDYSKVFTFFETVNPNKRVAIFPAQSFWNWQYRSFGYRGSGFLWQGIKQPVIERAFDPWSNYNEQFYNEVSYAIKTDNYELFKTVLEKYNVEYILLDQYIRESLTTQPINYDKLIDFLGRNNDFLDKKKTFGKLVVYQVNNSGSWVNFINTNKTLNIYPLFNNENEDLFTSQGKNYITEEKNPDIIPFFPSLFTGKLQSDLEFKIKEDKNTITLESNKKLAISVKNYQLQLPSIYNSDSLIPVKVKSNEGMLVISPAYPKIFINDREIYINEQDNNFLISAASINEPVSVKFTDTDIQIDNLQEGGHAYLLKKYLNTIRLKDVDGNEEIIVIDTNNMPLNPISLNLSTTEIDSLKVVIEKINSPFSEKEIIEKGKFQVKEETDTFSSFANPNAYASAEKQGEEFVYDIKGTARELAFYNQNLFHNTSYIIFAKTKYKSGLPISFYVDNPYESRAEIETRLSKDNTTNAIILPRTEEFYQGYGFHFIVRSVGNEWAQGSIEKIELYPFPLQLLRNLKIVNFNSVAQKEDFAKKTEASFIKKGNFMYEVKPVNGSNYLVLSQGYHEGWKAYSVQSSSRFNRDKVQSWLGTNFPFLFGEEIKEHVVVNNWENGWKVSNETMKQWNNGTIVVVFWPQYLQFLGFLMLPITLLIILKFK